MWLAPAVWINVMVAHLTVSLCTLPQAIIPFTRDVFGAIPVKTLPHAAVAKTNKGLLTAVTVAILRDSDAANEAQGLRPECRLAKV